MLFQEEESRISIEKSNDNCVGTEIQHHNLQEGNVNSQPSSDDMKNDESIVFVNSSKALTKLHSGELLTLKGKKTAPPKLPPRTDSLNSLISKRSLPPPPPSSSPPPPSLSPSKVYFLMSM